MERARQMDSIRNPSINAGQIVQHVIAIQVLQKGLCRLSRVAVRSDFLFSEATIFGMGNKPTSSCADIASAPWWRSFNLAPKPLWSRNLIREGSPRLEKQSSFLMGKKWDRDKTFRSQCRPSVSWQEKVIYNLGFYVLRKVVVVVKVVQALSICLDAPKIREHTGRNRAPARECRSANARRPGTPTAVGGRGSSDRFEMEQGRRQHQTVLSAG
ncbi:hypothetical protein B0H13DRAFT_1885598 [Mycena leptocephala]|nr:hypothetical protein B0H13DRAFT_1885598 [Mycena leptocephala]